MVESHGRRERKKLATRENIAAAARELFLQRGYDAVGVREIAAHADVAVTTLFAHFACKEALVFARDEDFEQRLTRAATDRQPTEPLIAALRDEIEAMVQHCSTDSAAAVWRIVNGSPALREYDESMRLRHGESLAVAIAIEQGLAAPTTACRALARFVIDAYSLAREADDPEAAVHEIFLMIDAAWKAAGPPLGAVTAPAAG